MRFRAVGPRAHLCLRGADFFFSAALRARSRALCAGALIAPSGSTLSDNVNQITRVAHKYQYTPNLLPLVKVSLVFFCSYSNQFLLQTHGFGRCALVLVLVRADAGCLVNTPAPTDCVRDRHSLHFLYYSLLHSPLC